MKEFATPSAFLAMEQAAGGINCWKKGQHFKGVEISVELGYLRKHFFLSWVFPQRLWIFWKKTFVIFIYRRNCRI